MDPVSLSIKLSSLAGSAFKIAIYISAVKDGGEERKNLGLQLRTLGMVLQDLQRQFTAILANGDQSWSENLRVLEQPEGVLSLIQGKLTKVQEKLEQKRGARKLWQSATWPVLVKEGVDRTVQQIYELHQELLQVLTQVNIAFAQEIRIDGAAVKDTIARDELKSCLAWLSPLNFVQRHQLIFKQAYAGTGKWFLDSPVYQNWKDETGSILWCPGIPGAGKSVLSSIVINNLQELESSRTDQKVTILMVYFAFDDANSQLPDLILGSLLKQVLQYRSAVPDELKDSFRKSLKDDTRPSQEMISTCLKSELGQMERIYIVMDGLDELLEDQKRREIIENVIRLNENINLMVTSRPLASISNLFGSSVTRMWCHGCEDDPLDLETRNLNLHHFFYHCSDCDQMSLDLCQSCYDSRDSREDLGAEVTKHKGHELVKRYCSLKIEIVAKDQDLRSYVDWRIENQDTTRRFVEKKSGLRDEILHKVIESTQGMFLLAKFHMDALVTKLTPGAIKEALKSLPTETDTTYGLAMQRINDMIPDHREKANLFLLWAAYSYRPLNIREIEHATLAMTLLAEDKEIDRDEIIPAKTLASMCAGLVIIDEMKNVRLCHYTVKNYLHKVRGQLFPSSDVSLARACLRYLRLGEFDVGVCADRDFDQRSNNYPFLGYAASKWGRHGRETADQSIRKQVVLFLESGPHRDAATQALWHLDDSWDAKSGVTSLHLASYFGLLEAVECLIGDHAKLDTQDSLGTTALMYATQEGHEAIVEKLLNAGANPHVLCSRGGTALHRAVLGNYVGIVKLLLRHKNLDVNAPHSGKRQSALSFASMCGYADVVKELLSKSTTKVNDLQSGHSALHYAVIDNKLDTVKLLLADPRTDIGLRSETGWSALSFAARYGNVSIVEALLDKKADINQKDSELQGGSTPILRAIDENRFDTVRLLYSRGANWDCKDKYARSLLHGAASSNRSNILRWLLQTQPGFDVNQQDLNGKTALHDAAFEGFNESLKVLLEFHARIDIKDKSGKTPLRTAREQNKLESYEILRKAVGEEIGSSDETETDMLGMSLIGAADIGNRVRVEEFIQSAKTNSNIDLDEQDGGLNGRTALGAAVMGGHLEIVELLIPAGVNINVLDTFGRTPLHYCAVEGDSRYRIAQTLIAAHADINLRDQWSYTPLLTAQAYNARKVALLLLEHGATIDKEKDDIPLLLSMAAYFGNTTVVTRLLDIGADPQRKDITGNTPIQLANQQGHELMAQFLLDFTTTKIRTSAIQAVRLGHEDRASNFYCKYVLLVGTLGCALAILATIYVQ